MYFPVGLAVLCLLCQDGLAAWCRGFRSFKIDKLGVWLSLCFFIHLVGLQKAEADYTLDESFWNEESPMGEVERLLREYRQNQELVRNIGAHYYQIIYPVQLRHHEKLGISTREIGAPKHPNALLKNIQIIQSFIDRIRCSYHFDECQQSNIWSLLTSSKFPSRDSGEGGSYQPGPGNTSRARSRTGKHFHRTSLLIKAFNHKFRLDLELNTQLLAPNLMQKHFLADGAEQVTKQEIEHCYYHGTVKDYPGATAAFHTCNGVSGVIHVGNETFVIHPFYGGDLSKHPHVIFEARTKANKGCALSGNLEWPNAYNRRPKHVSGLASDRRLKRDVLEATKYIETALVIDKAMFEKRNGSTRAEVVHDAIQVANIADLYFRTLNTRVSIVYIETWQGANQAIIDKSEDISRALLNFNDYTSRKLYRVEKDTAQLLTGVMFKGGEAGMSVPETVCTDKSVGISVDVNAYELHLLAGTMAHMIGHNIGMGHDGGREECFCRDWHGCIMAQSIVGLENVQPYKFSECSRADYNSALRTGHGLCLLNKPNQVEVRRSCGNRIIEEGEECDCGLIQECQENDPCCDPYTCKLKKESQCATGECCVECKLKPPGVECRAATNECDLPEHCNGEDGQCPPDYHKKNGIPCDSGKGYCFNGVCPTLDLQCKQIWGYSAKSGDPECFKQFNPKGSFSGHCGKDLDKKFIKCDNENALCGALQCQLGTGYPVSSTGAETKLYSRTIISMKGVEYECKTTNATMGQPDLPEEGLVRDGTPCGAQLVCVNQTCTSIFPFISSVKCPMNHNNLECSKHGICNNANKCHCEPGWTGPDCSIQVEITNTPVPDGTNSPESNKKPSLESQMKKKETPYENSHSTNTVFLVGTLMSVVGGVFIVFALSALCYRSVVVHKNFSLCLRRTTMPKPEPPYSKKPMSKGFSTSSLATPEEAAGLDPSKMPPFNSMPGYSGRDSQRVLFRQNHMGAGPPTSRFQDHKLQQIKRFAGSGSEDDPGHSGEEETVSFIDLPPNNLAKLPEKGILKKPCPYGGDDTCHKKWLEDAGADPQEILDNSLSLGPDMMSTGPSSEVERTLKSLNGYHEDILEALRNAASRHSGASSEDLLRRSLAAAAAGLDPCPVYNRVNSQDKLCSDQSHGSQTHVVMVENSSPSPSGHHHHRRTNHRTENQDDEEEEELPPSGPIRIRNLEDLIRQLEHKTTRHMSPSGSEDIRMSETEADRHYNRLDPQSGRVRGSSDFVYGRYRHGTGRGAGYLPEEEGIYESADQDRVSVQPREPPYNADTPDSESDDFIQAQQRLHRSASDEEEEDGGEVRVEGDSSQREDSPSPSNDQSALIPPGPKYPEYKH